MAIAAVGQICSTASMAHNLEQCVRLIGKAALGGAKVLFLPEASDYIASTADESLALARPQAESPFVLGIQAAAKKHAVAVNVGIHVPVPLSVPESVPVAVTADGAAVRTIRAKLLNRSLWVDADGSVKEQATYDKLHLFDYGALRESATVQAGTTLTAPFATAIGRIGSLICFDLRFPEPALALAQPHTQQSDSSSAADQVANRHPWANMPAQIITYPSAFTIKTGQAHWEVLLRARAIESQSWVVAAAQVGRHNEKRASYGHSMVVDPWGRVALELGGVNDDGRAVDGAEGAIGFVDVDLEELARVREQMPLQRRTDVYPEI